MLIYFQLSHSLIMSDKQIVLKVVNVVGSKPNTNEPSPVGMEFSVSEHTFDNALNQNIDTQHRIEVKVSDFVFKQMEAEKAALKMTWSQYSALVWLAAPYLKPEIYNKSANMSPGEKGLDRVYLS